MFGMLQPTLCMPLAKDANSKPLFASAFTGNGAEFARQAEASAKEQSGVPPVIRSSS